MAEYLDYQKPVTQIKGPKRDRKIQASKQDCNASHTRELNIWLRGRQKILTLWEIHLTPQTQIFPTPSIGDTRITNTSHALIDDGRHKQHSNFKTTTA